MNIGRRYRVAVEANGVQGSATQPGERATRAGLSVRGRRVSEPRVRDGRLLYAGERAVCVAFGVCVEGRAAVGWLVEDGRKTTAVLTRAKAVQADDRGCTCLRETASTPGLACGKQRRHDRWTRRCSRSSLCAAAGDPGSPSCLCQAASERKQRENREGPAQKPSCKGIPPSAAVQLCLIRFRRLSYVTSPSAGLCPRALTLL